MYQSLYRKWRPRTFDEICGQEHITPILRKQCMENRVSHAYLFCGTRGTGKTSMAKILAKAVNCENPVNGNPCNCCYSCQSIDSGAATDVLEIDAASNNGVDDIRDLRDEVVYPPSMLKKRVYIIDEVHMLSSGAFNALLKTLEEPPEYIVFILATTELSKLPATIISRCVRFDFTRLRESVIADRIRFVSEQENISLGEGAAELLARLADGAMRDGLSILEACNTGVGADQCITTAAIEDRIGLAGSDQLTNLMGYILSRDIPQALSLLETIHKSSKDLGVLLDDLSAMARDLLVMQQMKKAGSRYAGSFRYQKEELQLLQTYEKEITSEHMIYICSVLEETQSRIARYSTDKKMLIDLALIRLCDPSLSESAASMLSRISALEKKIAAGIPVSDTPAPAPEKAEPAKQEEPEQISFAEEPKADTPQETAAPKAVPFEQMAELTEELAGHPDLLPYLSKVQKAYISGNQFQIIADTFTNKMLQFGRNPSFLSEALRALTGKEYTLVFTDLKDTAVHSLIDELE